LGSDVSSRSQAANASNPGYDDVFVSKINPTGLREDDRGAAAACLLAVAVVLARVRRRVAK
jgi:hypothetical protein